MTTASVVEKFVGAAIVCLMLAPVMAYAQDGGPANVQPCKLSRLASLDLMPQPTGRFAVPVTISGTSFNFLVGLQGTSAVTDAVATQFRLHRDSTFGYRGPFISVMGLPVTESVEVPDFQIGSVHAAAVEMYVAGTMLSGRTLVFPEGDAVGGALGTTLFRNFGVEFDFNGKKPNSIRRARADWGRFSGPRPPCRCPSSSTRWAMLSFTCSWTGRTSSSSPAWAAHRRPWERQPRNRFSVSRMGRRDSNRIPPEKETPIAIPSKP